MIGISVLGDDISTNEYSYKLYDTRIYYEDELKFNNTMLKKQHLWWMQVIKAFDAELCKANTIINSGVSGWDFPSGLSDERIKTLGTKKQTPDIILIYLGLNDFITGTRIKGSLDSIYDCNCFDNAYTYMLHKIKVMFPHAKIVCGTLMRTTIKTEPQWVFPDVYALEALDTYNTAIRHACAKEKCDVAELGSIYSKYESCDGKHATLQGHKMLAEEWINALKNIDSICFTKT